MMSVFNVERPMVAAVVFAVTGIIGSVLIGGGCIYCIAATRRILHPMTIDNRGHRWRRRPTCCGVGRRLIANGLFFTLESGIAFGQAAGVLWVLAGVGLECPRRPNAPGRQPVPARAGVALSLALVVVLAIFTVLSHALGSPGDPRSC